MEEEYFCTLRQAAEYSKVVPQAIFYAIKMGRLKAKKVGVNWVISKKDLDQYRTEKYAYYKKKYQGEYIFDVEKGYFSVEQVAKIISNNLGYLYRVTRIYYLIRTGNLPAFRKGKAWIINRQDAIDLLKSETIRESKRA